MSLPSGYTALVGLILSSYFDTGVVGADDLEINYLYSTRGNTGYLFGVRNTNSNTSAGQYNLYYAGQGSASYFGYKSARVNIGTNIIAAPSGSVAIGHFYGQGNKMQWNTGVTMTTWEGATGTFTGTRNIWLGGLNNAGSLYQQCIHVCHGMTIKKAGTLIKDFVPCYDEANSKVGLYEQVGGQFYNLSTPAGLNGMYLITIGTSTGGTGYIKTLHGDKVDKVYAKISGINRAFDKASIYAVADDGYEFLNWTDGNGNVVSTTPDFICDPTADITLTPNFTKITDIDLNMNYSFVFWTYGSSSSRGSVQILSASVKTDALQKTTSTFYLNEVPSTLTKGCIGWLFSPKGKTLFYGVVESIEDNSVVCREILSVYDQEYLFSTVSNSELTVMYQIGKYMENADSTNFVSPNNDDYLLARKLHRIVANSNDLFEQTVRPMSLNHDNNPNFNYVSPTQNEVKNFEDYLLSVFNDYGIYVYPSMYQSKVLLTPFYYKLDEGITVSDNSEDITNVNVVYEDQEPNLLYLYNAAGTTLRGVYGVKLDGSITEFAAADADQFVANTDYKTKMIMSDDNILTILPQNLSNSHLNHKITFNVEFGGLWRSEDFYVGRPINFYVGDKLYQSVITSVSFDVVQNREQIANAQITIGKVRTDLTSKLNLGKVK